MTFLCLACIENRDFWLMVEKNDATTWPRTVEVDIWLSFWLSNITEISKTQKNNGCCTYSVILFLAVAGDLLHKLAGNFNLSITFSAVASSLAPEALHHQNFLSLSSKSTMRLKRGVKNTKDSYKQENGNAKQQKVLQIEERGVRCLPSFFTQWKTKQVSLEREL